MTSAQKSSVNPAIRAALRLIIVHSLVFILLGVGLIFVALDNQEWQTWALSIGFALGGVFGIIPYRWVRAGRKSEGYWLLFAGTVALTLLANLMYAGFGLGLGVMLLGMTLLYTPGFRRQERWMTWTLAILIGIGWYYLDLVFPFFTRPPAVATLSLPFAVATIALIVVLFAIQEFRYYSLQGKLIITFLFLSLFPLAVLAYVNNITTSRVLERSANTALAAVASQTAESIDQFLASNLQAVDKESQLPQLVTYLTNPTDENRQNALDLISQLRAGTFVLGNDDLRPNYWLVDARGRVLIDTSVTANEEGRSHGNRTYFLNASFSNQSYVSDVSFRSEAPEIYFAHRVLGPNQRSAGVLVIRYNSLVLQNILARNNGLAGEDSYGVLYADVDGSYMRLAHGTQPVLNFTTLLPFDEADLANLQIAGRVPDISVDLLVTGEPDLQANLENATMNPLFTDVDIDGGTTSQVAVEQMDNKRWLVAFYQAEDVFLAPVQAQARGTVLLALVISGFVFFLALFVSRILSRPLRDLTRVAEKVAGGDFSEKAQANSEDEIGTLATTFNSMTRQLDETLQGLETLVEERTQYMQASSDVARAASSILDPDRLIRVVGDLITERFGFYYTAVFIIDEDGRWAVLRYATGEAGSELLRRNHRLEIGGRSMVGTSISGRTPRVAFDVGTEAVRFNNPLLPETRSEIALPLIAGNRVLGALDAQSTEEAAFSDQVIVTLQSMANQIAVALENARLYQESQRQINEINRLNQVYLRRRWGQESRSVDQTLHLTEEGIVLTDEIVIPGLEEAVRLRSPQITRENGRSSLTVPLVLRNEVIGLVSLQEPGHEWTEAEIIVVQETLRQATIALENVRLVEETEARVQQEQMINRMTDEIRASVDVESILENTLMALGRELNIDTASIQLRPADVQSVKGGAQ